LSIGQVVWNLARRKSYNASPDNETHQLYFLLVPIQYRLVETGWTSLNLEPCYGLTNHINTVIIVPNISKYIYQIMSVSRNKNLIRKRWRIQAEVFVMWIYFHFKFFGCHFDLIFILIIIIITKNFFLTQVPGIFRYVRLLLTNQMSCLQTSTITIF
jgi:hypothetical protein